MGPRGVRVLILLLNFLNGEKIKKLLCFILILVVQEQNGFMIIIIVLISMDTVQKTKQKSKRTGSFGRKYNTKNYS